MPGTPLVFNGSSLQTDKYFISTITGSTTKRADSFAISHANKSAIPNIEYPNKIISISGQIVGNNIIETDNLIDNFYNIVRAQNAVLDVGWAGGFRRYYATASMPDIERPGGLAFANFTMNFNCTQPFGQDITPTNAVNATGRTGSTYSDSHMFLGTAPYQLTVITVTYTAVSGGTAKTVVIGNNNTGQSIGVTRTWLAGDVLQVDSINSIVTVNGIQTDFTGGFPTFQPGSQSIGYSDNLTSRTFNINASYNVMYI